MLSFGIVIELAESVETDDPTKNLPLFIKGRAFVEIFKGLLV